MNDLFWFDPLARRWFTGPVSELPLLADVGFAACRGRLYLFGGAINGARLVDSDLQFYLHSSTTRLIHSLIISN
jgi:hypothetical protein